MQQESRLEVHMERVAVDATYREELSYQLLSQCGRDADHVELRRVATRMFPELARSANAMSLASIIGHAATLRAQNVQRDERDVTDARLEMTATEPLAYPASYGDLEENMRASLIAFCERELAAGNDGPAALSSLLRLHGWPYSERTFYVGPWKAARLRTRRRAAED
jgi:hypothetical protein